MTVDPERLYNEGLTAFRRGDQETSLRLNEEALAAARAADDDVNVVRALVGMGRVAFRDGDHDRIVGLVGEAIPIYERLPDKTLVTNPVHMLAESARAHGWLEEARRHYEGSIRTSRAIDDQRMVAVELVNVALLEVAAGDAGAAEAAAREGIEMDFDPDGLPYALLALGAAAEIQGDARRAIVLLSAAHQLISVDGVVFDPAEEPLYRKHLDSAMAALGDEESARAEAEGRALAAGSARALALREDGAG